MPRPLSSSWKEPSEPLGAAWDLPMHQESCETIVPPGRRQSDAYQGEPISFVLANPDDSRDDEGEGQYAMTQTVGPPRAVPRQEGLRFPARGEHIGGFHVVSELGRGAFARVYLAEQTDLAGRPVALKVAEALGEEPRALARLQHTNIVPIHSVHDDPVTGLRLLCMPYFGGANLAQVLEQSGARLPTQASGRSLIDALDHVGGRPPSRTVARRQTLAGSPRPGDSDRGPSGEDRTPSVMRSIIGRYWARMPWWNALEGEGRPAPEVTAEAERDQPARRFLRSHTYVQASAWIAARLAEGLDHAHARGILHRDLKPSNILIAADGTPMLLDFNLATESEPSAEPDDGARAMIGGTLPYMAPEHLDAFNPRGRTRAEAVDERSDIYALGLILFEMAAGQHPFEDPPEGLGLIEVVTRMTAERMRGAPSVRSANPMVPMSLDAIVAKCLDPDPDRRYARAGDLAEDLNRHLDDRPNQHAPEPSWKERAEKWIRRHPQVRGAGPVAVMGFTIVLAVAATAWSIADYAENARARLARKEFHDKFAQCQLLLNTTSGPASHRGRGLALADKILDFYHVEASASWAGNPLVRRLPLADRRALGEEMSELILLTVRARVAGAGRKTPEADRRRILEGAIAWLGRAERIDPHPSAALFEDRARYHAALGRTNEATRDREAAAQRPPKTARDFYLRGTARAARGQVDLAEADLGQAVSRDPQRFWAWFVLGLCHLDRHRFEAAVGDFNACTLLAPEFAWPFLNRGIALAAANRPAEAKTCYDHALRLNPEFVEALVNRAVVCLEQDEAGTAEVDLAHAIRLGRNEPEVLAAHAEALSRLGRREQADADFTEALRARPHEAKILVARGFSRMTANPPGAEADFRRVLDDDPRHPRALLGMAWLSVSDPAAALPWLDRALEADPKLNDARQLRALLRARRGDPSAVIDVERLIQAPSPRNLYNAACALAILGQGSGDPALRDRAMEVLRRAIDSGFPAKHAATDKDLAALRSRPDFAKLTAPSGGGSGAR